MTRLRTAWMRYPRCHGVLLYGFLPIAVGLTSCWASGPMVCTVVSRTEMDTVIGRGFSSCQQSQDVHGAGWYCGTSGSFSCYNWCESCHQFDASNCAVQPGNVNCWRCTNTVLLRECAVNGTGTGCK